MPTKISITTKLNTFLTYHHLKPTLKHIYQIVMADNTNPGNFANRDKDEVSSIAQKGGQASTQGGFASMDPEKQVSLSMLDSSNRVDGQ